MPIPVLAGLPWLVSILGGLLGSLIGYFAKFVTRKLAVVAAVVAAMVALTAAFMLAIEGLASAVMASAPPELSIAASLVVPSNASACLSAILTGHLIRYAYEWNIKIVRMKSV